MAWLLATRTNRSCTSPFITLLMPLVYANTSGGSRTETVRLRKLVWWCGTTAEDRAGSMWRSSYCMCLLGTKYPSAPHFLAYSARVLGLTFLISLSSMSHTTLAPFSLHTLVSLASQFLTQMHTSGVSCLASTTCMLVPSVLRCWPMILPRMMLEPRCGLVTMKAMRSTPSGATGGGTVTSFGSFHLYEKAVPSMRNTMTVKK
mmetsp:Transcript_13455/g.19773  ORF Transcript_13455/g.19773 Transcript_13455/m.19773 type:complete len:203 (+) Transcript_13455:715-1323(+)